LFTSGSSMLQCFNQEEFCNFVKWKWFLP
jgi:hypothetical protein